jgi:hypothetical protein
MSLTQKTPAAAAAPDDGGWTRATLLREIRRPVPGYRWEWVGALLWPLSAICGVISYKGFTSGGWPAVNFGCALLCFNFAVSAIVNQSLAPLRRRLEFLSELAERQDQDAGPGGAA